MFFQALISGSENDLVAKSTALASSGQATPRFFSSCGTEDFLFQCNEKFAAHMKSLPLDFTYETGPGNHNWAYWDIQIQRALDWFALPRD